MSLGEPRELVHWFSRRSGPTTVLLHGFTGGAGCFDRVAAGCPGSVCALHLPGHHPNAPVATGFAASTAWVCQTLRHAGIERARLVGYSLGARVALSAAIARPSMWSSVVLISGHPGLDDDAARHTRRAADGHWTELLRGSGVGSFVDAWQALSLWRSQRAVAQVHLDGQRARRLGHSAEGLAGSLETLGLGHMPACGDLLEGLPMPVALVVGSLDTKFLAIAKQLARTHPQLALHVIERTGHNVILEAPDAVAALIWPA